METQFVIFCYYKNIKTKKRSHQAGLILEKIFRTDNEENG